MKVKVFRNFPNDITALFEKRAVSIYTGNSPVTKYDDLSDNTSMVIAKPTDEIFSWPHLLNNSFDWSVLLFANSDVSRHIDPNRYWACGFCFTYGDKSSPMGTLWVDGDEVDLFHGDFYILNAKINHGFVTKQKKMNLFLISSIRDNKELEYVSLDNMVIDL